MTLYQFSFLEKEEQESVISKEGTFIATREDDGFLFDLYQMGSFYVEFFYLTHDHGKIMLRCFTSTEELKPYLGIINIDEYF